MAVHSIFHVGFVVRDLDASIRFYTEGLGLRLRLQQTQDNDYTRSLVGYHDASLRVAQFLLPEGEPPASGHILELVEYVAPEGGPREDAMTVDGNVWTRAGEIPRRGGGMADTRTIYNYVSPGKHLARFEISLDKGAHWIMVFEAVGAKVS